MYIWLSFDENIAMCNNRESNRWHDNCNRIMRPVKIHTPINHVPILLIRFMDRTRENQYNAFYDCFLSLFCINIILIRSSLLHHWLLGFVGLVLNASLKLLQAGHTGCLFSVRRLPRWAAAHSRVFVFLQAAFLLLQHGSCLPYLFTWRK